MQPRKMNAPMTAHSTSVGPDDSAASYQEACNPNESGPTANQTNPNNTNMVDCSATEVTPTLGGNSVQQYSHNPYGNSAMHHAPGRKVGSLPSSPALRGFTYPPGYDPSIMQSPNSLRSQSGAIATAGPASSPSAVDAGVRQNSGVLTSPNASNATPRLRFRWDPYGSSLREESSSSAVALCETPKVTAADGRGGAGGPALTVTAIGVGAAVGEPSSAAHGVGAAEAQHHGGLGSPHVGLTLRQVSGGSPFQTPVGVGVIGGGSTSANAVAARTAPLTVEDLLANSQHLAHASPPTHGSGSPSLVAIDRRTLSSVNHVNDGKRYYLDYSPLTAPQVPTPIGGHARAPAAALPHQPFYYSTQPSSVYTTAMANVGVMGVGGGMDLFGEGPMPSLQLPDQELPLYPNPGNLLSGDGDGDGDGGGAGVEPEQLALAALQVNYHPEEHPLLEELHASPSIFLGKMLPPPPPVTTLLSVCSLQSVYANCSRYVDFIQTLRGGGGLCALGAATSGSLKDTPQTRPRDKARRENTSNNNKDAETAAPPQVPLSTIEAPPLMACYAVNTPAELERTRAELISWYGAAVNWWNNVHEVSSDAAAASGKDKKAVGPNHRTSPDSNNTLKGSHTRPGRGNDASSGGGGASIALKIDVPSRSVQSAVTAVVNGTVRRGDMSGGGGGGGGSGGYRGGRGGAQRGNNNHANAHGGGNQYSHGDAGRRGGGGYRGGGRGRGYGGGGGGGGMQSQFLYNSAMVDGAEGYTYGGAGRGSNNNSNHNHNAAGGYAYYASDRGNEGGTQDSGLNPGAAEYGSWGVQEGQWR